jgi:sortase A
MLLSGGYREEVTPVPIPNTEVKLLFGDDTWIIKSWESSALPVYQKRHRKMSFLFLCVRISFVKRKLSYRLLAKIFLVCIVCILILSIGLYAIINFDAFKISYFSSPESIKSNFEISLAIVKNNEDRVEIPSIGVAAKLLFPESNNSVDGLLSEGVVHLPYSAMPGENGNVVITGHSSSLVASRYKNIFAPINGLKPGDKIYVFHKNKKYEYEVAEKNVVKPETASVLSQKKNMLTLITCWPIGTDFSRLVVTAAPAK